MIRYDWEIYKPHRDLAMNKVSNQKLYDGTLQALHNLGGSATIREIHDEVVASLGLTEEEIALPHGPRPNSPTDIKYRLGWVRTWLKRYGLLENSSRGIWSLTAEGRGKTEVDRKEVDRVVSDQIKQEKESEAKSDDSIDDTEARFGIEESFSDESWREQLLTVLTAMDTSAFERLCQRLLRESGFTQVEVTGRSGDGGIDGVGVLRLAGFLSIRVLFQCKRYKGSIGAGIIRDFRGAMVGRSDKGLIVSTGNFTPAAQREATRDGAPEIDLVDGEQLIDKLKELSLGVETEEVIVERVTVDPDFFHNI
ncbi:MAG: restriction endonuclease [Chloroflexi bacterium]|nr:restriction endonuclease [Chloroflexota bacterium]